MKNSLRRLSAVVLLILAGVTALTARAAVDTKTATITATVNAAATLTLGANTVTFANASPTASPSIAATENAISVTVEARTSTAGSVTLTVLAADDLKSGSDVIDINNVTWTATGSGFVDGTLNKTTGQSVGSWTGPGTHTGTLSYFLANSFSYPTGSYTATITYTLTAP
jgi:hypothetical protein